MVKPTENEALSVGGMDQPEDSQSVMVSLEMKGPHHAGTLFVNPLFEPKLMANIGVNCSASCLCFGLSLLALGSAIGRNPECIERSSKGTAILSSSVLRYYPVYTRRIYNS